MPGLAPFHGARPDTFLAFGGVIVLAFLVVSVRPTVMGERFDFAGQTSESLPTYVAPLRFRLGLTHCE